MGDWSRFNEQKEEVEEMPEAAEKAVEEKQQEFNALEKKIEKEDQLDKNQDVAAEDPATPAALTPKAISVVPIKEGSKQSRIVVDEKDTTPICEKMIRSLLNR